MRTIIKRGEPASLTQHRRTAYADFDNYDDKGTLRALLVAEQRGICCYCLSPIRPQADAMKVEHWHCRERYPAEQLDYRNLLGACLGNEEQPPESQHCDTFKANSDLSRNPANPDHYIDRLVRFGADGTVLSDNEGFNNELNDVLNLNVPLLKNSRKATLDAFKATLVKRGNLKTATIQRWLRTWNGDSNQNDLRPFCQVVVYWLQKRLARN
jgi:uncharacterized protein (TIGR02646 family)